MKIVRQLCWAVVFGAAALSSDAASAALLYNPVVTVVGDRTNSSSGVGVTTSVYLYDNSLASQASPVSSSAFASAGSSPRLVNSFTATSEGSLTNNPGISNAAAQGTLYAGAAYAYSAGYDAPDNTSSVISSATNANRSLGRTAVSGNSVSGSTVLQTQTQASAYNNNNLRGATGNDNSSRLFSAGTGTTASTAGWRDFVANTQLPSGSLTNVRTVELLGSDLFGSTGSGSTVGVYLLDAAGIAPASSFISTGTSSNHSPYEFALFNDPTNAHLTHGFNVAYIADDGAANTASGGIEKWTYDGTSWTQAYILRDNTNTFYRGLAGQRDPSTGKFTLFASTSDGLKLQQVTDLGAASPFTTLASFTAADKLVFRGVALAPLSVPEPGTFILGALGLLGLLCAGRRRAIVRV